MVSLAGVMLMPLIVNGAAVVAIPPGVVTLIGPVVAPFGTVATTTGAFTERICAVTPLKVTALTPAPKPVPTIVT